jgi:hypothetical protein
MLRLKPASINWAIDHALKYGDTGVLPLPFEYLAIAADRASIVKYLSDQDLGHWQVRPARVLLAPKAKYSFRVITQLDPLDFLLFAGLIKEIANDIEASRIPNGDKRVVGYRVKATNDGQLYHPDSSYHTFVHTCRERIETNKKTKWVATADISDFYLRIYHHRLENALDGATQKRNHVLAIMRLLSGWNGSETYGIPIGSAPVRLLAECLLTDIDQAMVDADIDFCRFNDDYRIFATSQAEAYKHIVFLAGILYSNLGLSLQTEKTTVLSRRQFVEKYLESPVDRELNSLHDRFKEILELLGMDESYEPIEYDDLPDEIKEKVDALNVANVFVEEANREEPDMPILGFTLRRLGQLADDSVLDVIFERLESILPAFPDILRYISNLRRLDGKRRSSLGAKLIAMLDGSIVSMLPYHRL